MIRYILFASLISALLQLLNPALAEAPDPTLTPVRASCYKRMDTYRDCFYGWKVEDGKEREMTDAEIEAYINDRFDDGKPTTETWLDTYNLFRACSIRAGDKRTPRDDSKQWREMSLTAARTYFEQDPMGSLIAPWAAKYCKNEKWFLDRLLAMYEAKLSAPPDERAVALYNIGRLLDGAGEYALAIEAYASARSLFPEDSYIKDSLKRSQEKAGDYEASLKTLNKDKKPVDKESGPSIMKEARRNLEAAELLMKMGRDEKAQQTLEATWRMFGEAAALGMKEQHMANPLNQCATLLGLLALKNGDREKAIEWLKESFHEGPFSMFTGLDLRLVEKLMSDPSLHKLCERYLRLAYDVIYKKDKDSEVLMAKADAAKTLLERLTKEAVGADTSPRTAFHSGQGAKIAAQDEDTAIDGHRLKARETATKPMAQKQITPKSQSTRSKWTFRKIAWVSAISLLVITLLVLPLTIYLRKRR